MKPNQFISANAASDRVTISITGEIGYDLRAEYVMDFMRYYEGTPITMDIFSFGGSAYHAFAIYDYITSKGLDVEANIYGMCGSAATVISCAAKSVGIGENSFFFIHNAYNAFTGEQDEQSKAASERLVEIYRKKTKMDVRRIRRMMAEADESGKPISAVEALEMGFVDRVLKNKSSIAANMLGRFQNKPGEDAGTGEATANPDHSANQNTITMKLTQWVKSLFGDAAAGVENDEQAVGFLTNIKAEDLSATTAAGSDATTAPPPADPAPVAAGSAASAAEIEQLRQEFDGKLTQVVEQVKNLTDAVQAKLSEAQAAAAEQAQTSLASRMAELVASVDQLKTRRTGPVPAQATAPVASVNPAQADNPAQKRSQAAEDWLKKYIS